MSTSIQIPNGYAGFWKRGAAFFIDAVLIMFPQAFLGNIFGTAFVNRMFTDDIVKETVGYMSWQWIIAAVVAWVYMAGMESSPFQATLGKLILGAKVVDTSGNRLSFPRASARFFCRLLAALPWGLGLLIVGLTNKKQGLHDMMAGCLVVNKEVADAQTHYSHLQDFLRSPVIAASVIACAALIAISMYSQPTTSTESSNQEIPRFKVELSAIDLGTMNVALQTKEPLTVRQAHMMSRYLGSVDPIQIQLTGEHQLYNSPSGIGGKSLWINQR